MSIKAPSRPLRGASAGVKRLAAAVRRGERQPNLADRDSSAAPSRPLERYVTSVSQSLAVFRLVSFALGAGLAFALDAGDWDALVLGPVVLLVGLFNVYRILWRFDPARSRDVVQGASLGVDVALSISLILISGGLDSPFLIYSLSPILTASLLMNLPTGLAAAGISSPIALGAFFGLAGVKLELPPKHGPALTSTCFR